MCAALHNNPYLRMIPTPNTHKSYNIFFALACIFQLLVTVVSTSSDHACPTNDYSTAATVAQDDQVKILPGFTRSVTRPHSFMLLTPHSRVYANAPPGWQGQLSSAAVVTPALGSHFSMYLVDANGPANLKHPVSYPGAPSRLERLFYVLSGTMLLINGSAQALLTPGAFVYFSPGDRTSSIETSSCSMVQIDRIYAGAGQPASMSGNESQVQTEHPLGEVFRLKRLLDTHDADLDFNIHIMDFSPGEFLNVKEVHYNQHALLMLHGQGLYRLNDVFVPVGTGDIIYMAPFVTQWYAALGTVPTRYFLYKDINVNPLIS